MTGAIGWPLAAFIIAVGPAVGSFLMLLADRLPRDEDVIRRPSHCEACGARIGWRDRIPLVSWLALRGRCRHCHAGIPQRLFLAEIAGLGAGVLGVAAATGAAEALAGAVFLWCVLGLVIADLRAHLLPDALTAMMFLSGVALAWIEPARSIPGALGGAAAGGGAFWLLRGAYWWLRGREGLGLGDVKLMAAIGAALGVELLALNVLLASLSGLAAALAGARERGVRAALDGGREMPFGAFLALAAAALWLAHPQ